MFKFIKNRNLFNFFKNVRKNISVIETIIKMNVISFDVNHLIPFQYENRC